MFVFQTLGVFKRYPAKQVQQPMCLHKISWRDLGGTFQLYPHSLIHFLRELLCIYLPQEYRVGNVIASPGDVFTWLNAMGIRVETG